MSSHPTNISETVPTDMGTLVPEPEIAPSDLPPVSLQPPQSAESQIDAEADLADCVPITPQRQTATEVQPPEAELPIEPVSIYAGRQAVGATTEDAPESDEASTQMTVPEAVLSKESAQPMPETEQPSTSADQGSGNSEPPVDDPPVGDGDSNSEDEGNEDSETGDQSVETAEVPNTLIRIEASKAAFSHTLHKLAETVPDIQANFEQIQRLGEDIISYHGIDDPEFFNREDRTLLLGGLADKVREASDPSKPFEEYFRADMMARTGGEVLARESSENYRASNNPVAPAHNVPTTETIDTYERLTDDELTEALRQRAEEDILPATRGRMKLDVDSESPFEIRVLDLSSKEKLEDLTNTLKTPYIAEAWVHHLSVDGEYRKIMLITHQTAKAVLGRTEKDEQETKRYEAVIKHEYVHTQGTLVVDTPFIGGTLEELRADRISQDSSYDDLGTYLDAIEEIVGKDVGLEELICTSRDPQTFYPELARRIGLQNTVDMAFAPIPTRKAGSWRMEQIEGALGGLDGIVQRVRERQQEQS